MKFYVVIFTLVFYSIMMRAESATAPKPEAILFRKGDITLHGCVYKPNGKGPFPAIVFNQSATRPSYEKIDWPPFPALAQFFATNGYVFFLPGRYNHDAELKIASSNGTKARWKVETDVRNADVIAGIDWLKAQSYVDENRVVLCGHSAGAIQSLLVAEKVPHIRGTITFSVGAISWKGSAILQKLLQDAVQNTDTPIFILQPQNDISIEPSRVLGDILRTKPQPNRVKVYPPFGPTPAEANLFGLNGANIWGDDVLKFLQDILK